MKNRVRIVSDGLPFQTKVYVDDEQLLTCTRASWEINADGYATASLDLIFVDVDVMVEGESWELVLGTAAKRLTVTSKPEETPE